jgi:hypothetical protein
MQMLLIEGDSGIRENYTYPVASFRLPIATDRATSLRCDETDYL